MELGSPIKRRRSPLRLRAQHRFRCCAAAGLLPTLLAFACVRGAAQAQRAPNFIIDGRVEGFDGAPIRGARIAAENDRPCSEKDKEEGTASDADGHFQLRLPCPGVWRLNGEAQGYPKQFYEQHDSFSTGIALSAAHPEHEIVFKMLASSSILGTVLDEAGDPVRDAQVFLLMPGSAQSESLRTVDQTTTDDRGMYEFSDVTAGGYNVAVQAQPWYAVAAQSSRGSGFSRPSEQQSATNGPQLDPSLDLTYPITFYPAAGDAASASRIEVAGGATQQADIHLSPIPSVHVLIPAGGRSTLSLGGGARMIARGGPAPAIQQLSEFGALRFDPTSVNVMPDGSLDVGGFAPGDYALANVRSRDEANRQEFTIAKDAGRTTVALSAATPPQEPRKEAAATLSGTVVLAQTPCQGALLLLVPIAGASPSIRRQQSNTDGSFSFEKVPLGKYILTAVDRGWAIDWKDPRKVAPYLAHGMPIDLNGSIALRTALQAQPR